jgi:hypothetical protein
MELARTAPSGWAQPSVRMAFFRPGGGKGPRSRRAAGVGARSSDTPSVELLGSADLRVVLGGRAIEGSRATDLAAVLDRHSVVDVGCEPIAALVLALRLVKELPAPRVSPLRRVVDLAVHPLPIATVALSAMRRTSAAGDRSLDTAGLDAQPHRPRPAISNVATDVVVRLTCLYPFSHCPSRLRRHSSSARAQQVAKPEVCALLCRGRAGRSGRARWPHRKTRRPDRARERTLGLNGQRRRCWRCRPRQHRGRGGQLAVDPFRRRYGRGRAYYRRRSLRVFRAPRSSLLKRRRWRPRLLVRSSCPTSCSRCSRASMDPALHPREAVDAFWFDWGRSSRPARVANPSF